MPAPPFLVGLSAGASVAVLARVVAHSTRASSSSSSSSQSPKQKGIVGLGGSGKDGKEKKKEKMIARPKLFQRVPPSERPKDPCVECCGSGRVECPECRGRGGAAHVDSP